MDTINFLATPATFNDETYLEVFVTLNGVKVDGGLIDVSSIIFGASVNQSSFYFFTCSCGVAGCDGYHQPLDHIRREDSITWLIEDEKLAEVFGSEKLEFEAAQFDSAIAYLKSEIVKFEAQNIFCGTMNEINYSSEGDEDRYVGVTLAHIADSMTAYYQGQDKMAAACNEAADPNDPCKMRFTWGDAAPSTNGGPGGLNFYEKDAVDIAANLLNLGESIKEEDAPRVAELRAATQIIRDFSKSKDQQTAEDSFRPLRRFMQEDEVDSPDTAIFGMDDVGPFVRLP